ncbi:dTDP-4-dehydrorhamnose reductase [Chromohalobacter canadensis]|uniref:dTDP-4-dehydrorhamnose reductase n=1 Tax=Chromohalobacter canadensis TaxID=141389 RepID=A0ABZ0YFW0_9GAMM|nr:dTDP-4-dehydrorhamnose reductase [Chromohalobacter canadensis]MCK0770333.1 dTDP-4-dehydrorhamnose reductase [Chromohalobacter canadensis]WQH10791.1 dTDP-4-dehydrorhamnose reductase [Chromohalobacter canadensis]
MNIFLTGANGQVGFELERQLSLLGHVLAPKRQELDLSDAEAVETWLKSNRPELIVNAAAYTAVDKAESEPTLAQRLNVELPAQLAAYCADHQIPLVHYSSDYVYPGDGEQYWQESSEPRPLSVYGQTKLEGDRAIEASGCRHLIFRTSWIYSARGNNFMKTMLRLGREREALSVVADQIGAPTPARLIAQVTSLALEQQLSSGIYHLAPRGETSWCGFAREIFRLAASHGEQLAISPEMVDAIPTANYPTPAARPLNSRLALEKLERELERKLPEWQPQLALTLKEHLVGSS